MSKLKNKIDGIFNTKSIKINAIFNAVYQVLIVIIPLITTPYLSRVFGVTVIGQYGYYSSFVGYFLLFANFGFLDYGTKKIAQYRDHIKEKSIVFWNVMTMKMIFSMFAAIVYIGSSFIFLGDKVNFWIYFSGVINLFGAGLDTVFLFQGEERFISITIRNFIIKIGQVILIFLVIKSPDDVIIYSLIIASISLCNALLLFLDIKHIKLKKPKVKDLNFREVIQYTLPYFIPGLAVNLFVSLNATLLGSIGQDNVQNGLYSQALKFINVLNSIAGSLSGIMLSRISYLSFSNNKEEKLDKLAKSFEAFWIVAFPLVFGFVSVSNILLPKFFGPGYDGIVPIAIVLSATSFFSPFNSLIGNGYYRPENKIWTQTYILLATAAVNIALCLVLIKPLGAMGAVIARTFSEFFQCVLLIIFCKKDLPLKTLFRGFDKIFFISLVMTALVFFSGNFLTSYISNEYFVLVIMILVGIISYYGLSMLFKVDMVTSYSKIFFNKVKGIFIKNKKAPIYDVGEEESNDNEKDEE